MERAARPFRFALVKLLGTRRKTGTPYPGKHSPQPADWDDRQRFIIALAIAIAVHEIVAGVFPWQHRPSATTREIVTIARITRIAHRPKPTPKPTPTPIIRKHVISQSRVRPVIVNPGNPAPREQIVRRSAARPIARTQYHRAPAQVHVRMAAQAAGTGSGNAASGSIGAGGNGSGQNGSGNGSGGAPAGQEPCGAVYFEPRTNQTIDPATGRVWEYLTMIVHFPDGSQENVDLDYPFYYPSQSQDPFNVGSNAPATFQFPPSAQRGSEPAIVQYVMRHTRPDGYTRLRDC